MFQVWSPHFSDLNLTKVQSQVYQCCLSVFSSCFCKVLSVAQTSQESCLEASGKKHETCSYFQVCCPHSTQVPIFCKSTMTHHTFQISSGSNLERVKSRSVQVKVKSQVNIFLWLATDLNTGLKLWPQGATATNYFDSLDEIYDMQSPPL